jgi:hypothetical protein
MSKTLREGDFERAAQRLGCTVAAVKAVTFVESRGGGFNPNGSLKTLFEAHHFHRLTGGRFTGHPEVVRLRLSVPRWDRTTYGRTWLDERRRLAAAMAIDRDAALQSASWGMFQVMGFNHRAAGYPTAQAMVDAYDTGEGVQLDSFVSLIVTWGLDDEMRTLHLPASQAAFARVYNGPRFAENQYDVKIGRALAQAQRGTLRLPVAA